MTPQRHHRRGRGKAPGRRRRGAALQQTPRHGRPRRERSPLNTFAHKEEVEPKGGDPGTRLNKQQLYEIVTGAADEGGSEPRDASVP